MRFRPSLESLDGRIVPDATGSSLAVPPELTITYVPDGQTESVTLTIPQAVAAVENANALAPNPIQRIKDLVGAINLLREHLQQKIDEATHKTADAEAKLAEAADMPPGPERDALLAEARRLLDEAIKAREEAEEILRDIAKMEKEILDILRPVLPRVPVAGAPVLL